VAAVDDFASYGRGLGSPYRNAAAVSPSDSGELAHVTLGLYVGVQGALTVVTAGGDEATFAVVPAGTTIPIRVTQVKETGTDADSIVALW
jgi:hypothetical protein